LYNSSSVTPLQTHHFDYLREKCICFILEKITNGVINVLYKKMTKKEKILRLHKTGMKQVDIARELKTYTNYVWKVINDNNDKK
jgi:hypothetical protein